MKDCHTRGCGSSAEGKDIAYSDVLNEGGVETGMGVDGPEDMGKEELGLGVLESTLFALGDGCAEGADDDDVCRGFCEDFSAGGRHCAVVRM